MDARQAMEVEEAFRKLIEMGEERAKRLRNVQQLREAQACAIGADYIRQMSGCWFGEERENLLGAGWSERLSALEAKLKL